MSAVRRDGKVLPSVVDAALAYARRGWQVVPLHVPVGSAGSVRCTCNRAKCSSIGKHPRTKHGLKDGSVDAEKIRAWFGNTRMANVGIVTGAISGLFVLDVDARHGGPASLQRLEAQHGELPPTVRCTTSAGSEHIYFRVPPGVTLPNAVKLVDGLDTRGDGGYVVAPPSLHATGFRYAWQKGWSPSEIELAIVPDWLVRMLVDRRAVRGPASPMKRGRDYLRKVPHATEGSRNETAFKTAGYLFALVEKDGGRLDESQVVELMRTWNAECSPPLDDVELVQCIRNAQRNGTPPPDKPARGGDGPRRPGADDASGPNALALTDSGNAERFAARFGRDFRYCCEWKVWLWWDGSRWTVDGTDAALLATKTVARSMLAEASSIADNDRRESLVKHALKSEKLERRRAMLALAACESPLALSSTQLDRDRWALNCINGALDLRTGELRAPRREDFFTKRCSVVFSPSATCPRWERFLERVLPDDELRAYLQRVVGYALTGDVSEQVMFALVGEGANGKSTFTSVLQRILTTDYAIQVPADLLIDRGLRTHPTEFADLFGVRMAVGTELNPGSHFDEALIKALTGGDPIRARRMRQDFWQFEPSHKLFLVTNTMPVVRGRDLAIYRRFHVVRFEVVIPPEERDRRLLAALEAELPGILAWAVRGCVEWQQGGLCAPQGVTIQPPASISHVDPIAEFLATLVVRRPGSRLPAERLYAEFSGWCAAREFEIPTQTAFGMQIGRCGFGRKKIQGRSVYMDMDLLDPAQALGGGLGRVGEGSGNEPIEGRTGK